MGQRGEPEPVTFLKEHERERRREGGEREREASIIAIKYRKHYDRSLHDGGMVVAQWKNECYSVSQQLDHEEHSMLV